MCKAHKVSINSGSYWQDLFSSKLKVHNHPEIREPQTV